MTFIPGLDAITGESARWRIPLTPQQRRVPDWTSVILLRLHQTPTLTS